MILKAYDITLPRALRLIGLSSSMYYYKPKRDDSEPLKLMSDYADENPTLGQDMMVKVFHKSHGWNHRKTVRLYHKLRLPIIGKRRLRRLVEPVEPLVQPIVENETWSMDFMSDSLMDGGKVRVARTSKKPYPKKGWGTIWGTGNFIKLRRPAWSKYSKTHVLR